MTTPHVDSLPPVNPSPTRPRRMVASFDVALNAIGEKATVTHPVPLTDSDITRIVRYLNTLLSDPRP